MSSSSSVHSYKESESEQTVQGIFSNEAPPPPIFSFDENQRSSMLYALNAIPLPEDTFRTVSDERILAEIDFNDIMPVPMPSTIFIPISHFPNEIPLPETYCEMELKAGPDSFGIMNASDPPGFSISVVPLTVSPNAVQLSHNIQPSGLSDNNFQYSPQISNRLDRANSMDSSSERKSSCPNNIADISIDQANIENPRHMAEQCTGEESKGSVVKDNRNFQSSENAINLISIVKALIAIRALINTGICWMKPYTYLALLIDIIGFFAVWFLSPFVIGTYTILIVMEINIKVFFVVMMKTLLNVEENIDENVRTPFFSILVVSIVVDFFLLKQEVKLWTLLANMSFNRQEDVRMAMENKKFRCETRKIIREIVCK